MNNIQINLGQVDNSCFVVMPFSNLFQTEYEKIIQPALRELGIECIRGDEIYTKQTIVDDIWCSVKKCRFVLAELTGKNPNVLYEIGLAHAIGKPVIIITRNGDDVPFDLKALRYLFYDVNDPFWGENLKLGIQNLVRKVIDSPTIENYLQGINLESIKYPELVIQKIVEPDQDTPDFDITGTWLGEFEDNAKITHRVTLQINQKDTDLLGAAIITCATQEEDETIVQQIMNGSVNTNGDIKFYGVNYTFIKSGDDGKKYVLDNFTLKYIKQSGILFGVVDSAVGDAGLNTDITFKKM